MPIFLKKIKKTVAKKNGCYIILLNLINCINTDEITHDPTVYKKSYSVEG